MRDRHPHRRARGDPAHRPGHRGGDPGTDASRSRVPDTAILVIVIYAVLRQVEDQLVSPVVIGRAVHLHPVVTIFAVLVGLSTYGILGGLLGGARGGCGQRGLPELYPPEPAVAPA